MSTDPTQETILTYEGIAEYYATVEDDPELRASIRDLLGPAHPGKKILEVGCGPGIDAAILKSKGFDVIGIDLCEAFIDRARLRYPEVDFQLMDLRAPDFKDNEFDGIIAMASLVHVLPEDIPATIERYRLLLKDGGRFVTWMSDSPKVEYYDVPDWGGASTRFLRMWCHDRSMISNSMTDAGFSHVRILQVQSDYYNRMTRIQDNEVSLYAIVGTVPG
ncbi:MAG: class I SAM-dependent methyltransferase [Phycisphaerales bacterium]|nr:class I SAM-dependent methyltransferase [Phycisphaerales bacterium]